MKLSKFFKKHEQLTSIDIGASSVKLVELELGKDKPTLKNLASMPLEGEVFANNVISKTEAVADVISALIEANGIEDKRVVTCVPGPTVFTKRIKTAKMPYNELVSYVQLEASNFIPHNIDAVRLDFHALRESGKNQLELLVVAVKNEVIDSILDTLSLAGLEAAIIDIDYFALQNIFEFSYPEKIGSTVALVDFGSRYSSVNIVQNGISLFTGDVSAGSRMVSDNLQEAFSISKEDAENITSQRESSEEAKAALAVAVEALAKDFNRQLSFFWSATGSDQGIESIYFSGGASRLEGFKSAMEEVTGLPCEFLDPFRNVQMGDGLESGLVKQMTATAAVACGMALREPGDRVLPEEAF
ncbi:MAG: type IV pilus assembly protein PilM [Bdellovibrionales bacterium]|nr:type IV pilus assembly protein PilM [Bdellovibrionales bacterium]